MSGTKKTFLLPCGSCAGEIEVVAGQAGGRVECRSCGSHSEVPTFRDLGRLRVRPEAIGERATRWSWQHAMVVAGIACAALAWGTAAAVGSFPRTAYDHAAVRARIHAADDESLYRALQEFATAQVARGMSPEERLLQRKTLFADGMSRVLFAIGGLGAVAAVVAGGALALRPGDRGG